MLYTLANNGILSAYDGKTSERLFHARVGEGGGFSALPIAADGRLYLASEDGDVFVVAGGRTSSPLAKNPMGEAIMATPAISDGLIDHRTYARARLRDWHEVEGPSASIGRCRRSAPHRATKRSGSMSRTSWWS